MLRRTPVCRSPDELSTAELERLLNLVTGWLENPYLSSQAKQVYEGRIKGYTEILKERANEGVI
jgi:hypothetical protein